MTALLVLLGLAGCLVRQCAAAPPADQGSATGQPAALPSGYSGGSTPINGGPKPAAPPSPAAAPAVPQATPGTQSAPPTASAVEEQTSGQDKMTCVRLNIQHLDIGIPLPLLGKNLAVVPAIDGHKCVGLNGVSAASATFAGKGLKSFQIEAALNCNLPFREGTTFSSELLSLRLGTAAERRLLVTIKQGEAEPPMAVFSLAGPKFATDMYCSSKPLRWKEDQPDATTNLLVKKEAGAIRFEYDGELVCTSPLDPNLPLTTFSAPLTNNGRVYNMVLTQLPDTLPGATPSGQAAGEAREQPISSADMSQANGLTRIDLTKLTPGTPTGSLGKNLIVLGDEEGKYIASATPEGSYVLLPVQDTGKDFSVGILIKNAFVLNTRSGSTDRFFLFRINYKNGISELYAINLTRSPDIVWRSRYFISRSGQDKMDWTVGTDYRPWNNALDFNEYKVIKEKELIRFFVNGEFIRSEKTLGDVLASVKVDLRANERLYDIIVRDLAVAGPEQKNGPGAKDPKHGDSRQEDGQAATPAKGNGP